MIHRAGMRTSCYYGVLFLASCVLEVFKETVAVEAEEQEVSQLELNARHFEYEIEETQEDVERRLNACADLKSHIQSLGGMVHERLNWARSEVSQGLGIFLSGQNGDIRAKQRVLAVPWSVVMSPKSADNCPILGPLLRSGAFDAAFEAVEQSRVLMQRPSLVLTLHLALELEQQKQSRFQLYLDTLPVAADLPLHWAEKTLRRLRGTGLEDIVHLELRPQLVFLHDKLAQVLAKSGNGLIPTLKTFARAYGLVTSRSVASGGMPTLVPLLDQISHAGGIGSNEFFSFSGSEVLIMGFKNSISPGQELYVNYDGPEFTSVQTSFFMNYGFVDTSGRMLPPRLAIPRKDLIDLGKLWEERDWGDNDTIKQAMELASDGMGKDRYEWIFSPMAWYISENLPLEVDGSAAPEVARLTCLLRLRATHPDDVVELFEAADTEIGPDCAGSSSAWVKAYPETEAIALAELTILLLHARFRLQGAAQDDDAVTIAARERIEKAATFHMVVVRLCDEMLANVTLARMGLQNNSNVFRDVLDDVLESMKLFDLNMSATLDREMANRTKSGQEQVISQKSEL